MRHTKHIPLLLASALMASVTFAQTRDGQAADRAPAENAILAARSRYIQTVDISPDASNTILAQLPRGGPARPSPPQRGYPRGTYQTPWMDHGNAKHIVIGAAIGFGVGAALGANNSAHNGTPVAGGIIVGGGLLGLIGGCIGEAVGAFPGFHYSSARRGRVYEPTSSKDDGENFLQSNSKPMEGQPEGSAKPTWRAQPAGVDAMDQASSMPVVP